MYRIILYLIFILPVYAVLAYFMYRYRMGKETGKKENSYDFTGMLFLLLPTLGGTVGLLDYGMSSCIENHNTRIVVALVICLAVIALLYGCVWLAVRRKNR
ncbi:MAG: hypothetical protein J5741_04915 [Bacteroidales bacterium]|nr:hypothetical protein [Bacteroidales bacterium]